MRLGGTRASCEEPPAVLEDDDEDGGKGAGEHEGVDAVEDAAMGAEQLAVVLKAAVAFDEGHREVADVRD